MEMPIRVSRDFAATYPDASASATECAMNLARTGDLVLGRVALALQPLVEQGAAEGIAFAAPSGGPCAGSLTPLPAAPAPPRSAIGRESMSRALRRQPLVQKPPAKTPSFRTSRPVKKQESAAAAEALKHRSAFDRYVPKFFRDIISELRKVTWPTREETTRLTVRKRP